MHPVWPLQGGSQAFSHLCLTLEHVALMSICKHVVLVAPDAEPVAEPVAPIENIVVATDATPVPGPAAIDRPFGPL